MRKYLAGVDSKSPTPQTGSDYRSPISKSPTHPHTGSLASGGPASLCDPWAEEIEKALLAGLSVQRIYQDLVSEHQFTGSYYAVRRFVRRHHGTDGAALPADGVCAGPGVAGGFWPGAWVVEEGKRRRPHLFRCVLSHSRKGLQRGGLAADHRELHPLSGKCLPPLWRGHGHGGDRQPEGGCDPGRLV